MARLKDDDTLEPILPKHPPVAGEEPPPMASAADTAAPAAAAGPPAPAWHRTVLVVCAVVATVALVFSAVQLSSIAEDQRLQACQIRVYAEESILADDARRGRGRSNLQERFAECLGVDVATDDDGRDGGGSDD